MSRHVSGPLPTTHPGEEVAPYAWRRATVLSALLFGEILLFALLFDLGAVSRAVRSWPAFSGVQLLAGVGFAVLVVALLFGRVRAAADVQPTLARLGRLRQPVPLLLVQAPLLLGLLWLTSVIAAGGEAYLQHFLRYAVGWLLLALAGVTVWSAALLPAGFWLGALRYGSEALVAVAIAGALVCVGLPAHPLWHFLNDATVRGARELLGLLYQNVVFQPDEALLGTPSFTPQVACACGGIEGIGLSLIFLSVYLWLFREALRFPRALLLLPLAVALMWSLNVVRITALVVLETENLPGVSPEGFHSQAGWLAFLGIQLGLVLLSRRARLFSRADAPPLLTPRTRAAAAYLTPVIAIVGVATVGRVFAGGFDWLFPLRVVAAGIVLFLGRGHYGGALRRTWSWRAVALGVVVFLVWLALEPLSADPSAGAALRDDLGRLPPRRGRRSGWPSGCSGR